MIVIRFLTCCLVLVTLSACNEKQEAVIVEDKVEVKPKFETKLEDSNTEISSDILASVNKTHITKSQLDYAVSRLLPRKLSDTEKDKLSEKILESLIDSRLMAVLAEDKLDDEGRRSLAIKVAAYREELLTKQYIVENITPQPVTRDEVYQYYLDHQNDFGGGIKKEFEIIQTKENLKDADRKILLIELSKLSETKDWATWVTNNKHLNITYKKSVLMTDLLKNPLKALIEKTKEGETSPVQNEKKLTIVRVNKINKISPKIFEQVSREIRRKMAPRALKTSIRNHLKEIRKNAEIDTYLFNNIEIINKSDSTGVIKK